MKFLVIGDLHYKKNMYAVTLSHLDRIMRRAYDERVDFVIHTGDFCNDYMGSPELMSRYLDNAYNLPVYGIYGNHELETRNNTMEIVTPKLCNRPVIFGGEGTGYWYCDMGQYRIIGIDTNYSFHEETSTWQHNLPASWGAPDANKLHHSLGPVQLKWLDEVICQAGNSGKKVIIISHAALSGEWASSPDAEAVREIFQKYPGTVILNINGHLHTDHFCVKDNIAYFDVCAAINGCWAVSQEHHYEDHHTYLREKVLEDGAVAGDEVAQLNSLTQGKNTWFLDSPLSAIVEVEEGGQIKITGSRASWVYSIVPDVYKGVDILEIPDRTAKIM